MGLQEPAPSGDYRFDYTHLQYDDRSFFQKMMFWRDYGGPSYSGIYQTRLEAEGENTRIFLNFGTGSPATTSSAEHVLGIFMDRLG